MTDSVCFNCQKTLVLPDDLKISRQDTCEYCGAHLRSCKMCHFYDLSAYNDCREPNAERVVEKEKANFCSYFQVSDGSSGPNKETYDKQKLFNAAEELFKKK